MGTLLGPEGTTMCGSLVGGCGFTVVDVVVVSVFGLSLVLWWGFGFPGMTWPAYRVDRCLPVWWVGFVAGVGVVVVGWSFVENYTVDASIFVVKLSRANGGCLGTRSR